ncbi:Domain of uncharacterised function (DUF2825) [Salmonella enterica subsp. enterica serovar Typhimurium str. DT104]|nr:Domain of uncharacterised function (DUF2825) [Salmonella enterica subsp. enterica serovar Typhimurium str. DT104]
MPAVYPRWRGEHGKATPFFIDLAGLSPLARGTPRRRNEYYVSKRFIPAGAGNTRRGRGVTQPLPVYPRWRGEHSTVSSSLASNSGLSPLARGTLMATVSQTVLERFIPAGAGNTVKGGLEGDRQTVYPRWRGEHDVTDSEIYWDNGLSPLARGTRNVNRVRYNSARFIPAGAGNTLNGYNCL